MADLLMNNWIWWISDDAYLGRNWEVADMSDIEIRDTGRKITMSKSIKSPTYFASWSVSTRGNLIQITDTPYGLVSLKSNASTTNSVWLDSNNMTTTISGGPTHNQQFDISQYSADQHFIFSYNWAANNIYVLSSNMGTLNATKDTVAGAQSNAHTTATCNLWDNTILYAKSNNIYAINTTTWAISGTAKATVYTGSVIKYMYLTNDLVIVVSVVNGNTYFHTYTVNAAGAMTLRYEKCVLGFACISAVWDNGTIYWISAEWVHMFSWENEQVKFYIFTTSARVNFNKNILRIVDGTNFYEYGKKKPWYSRVLSKKTISQSMPAVSQYYIWVEETSESRAYLSDYASYIASGSIISLPYTAWEFWINKKGMRIRIWYDLPILTQYTSQTVLCSILVQVRTNVMKRAGAWYLTVLTISDISVHGVEVLSSVIAKALNDLSPWYSTDFNHIEVKLILNAGDEFAAAWSNTLYKNTPEVFDFHIAHDEITQSF